MSIDNRDFQEITPAEIENLPTRRAYYSDRTALLMAKLAKRVYERFELDDRQLADFRKDLEMSGLTDFTPLVNARTGTAGFVAATDDIIVVVFRGTENLLDWRTNVMAKWFPIADKVLVHRGFHGALEPVRIAMLDAVDELIKRKERSIYITGHSLGGALATMATAELAQHSAVKVQDCIAACYTFGSPRVGNSSYDQHIKVPLYRITNGVDMVPAVPPVIIGYRHVGDTRYFGKVGLSPSRRSPTVYQKTWRTLGGLLVLLRTFKFQNIADHAMDVYIDKLDAWARLNAPKPPSADASPNDTEMAA